MVGSSRFEGKRVQIKFVVIEGNNLREWCCSRAFRSMKRERICVCREACSWARGTVHGGHGSKQYSATEQTAQAALCSHQWPTCCPAIAVATCTLFLLFSPHLPFFQRKEETHLKITSVLYIIIMKQGAHSRTIKKRKKSVCFHASFCYTFWGIVVIMKQNLAGYLFLGAVVARRHTRAHTHVTRHRHHVTEENGPQL